MNFPYDALRRIVREDIIPNHDAVIEGGIGNNFGRYQYFRGLGYGRIYIAINNEDPNISIPDGINYFKGNCFNPSDLDLVFSSYSFDNPLFLTNSALTDSLLNRYDTTKLKDVVGVLTQFFKKQLHIKPTGNKFSTTIKRIYYPETIENEEHKKLIDFLEESKKQGWEVEVPSRNIVIMKR
ncbi:hypothetical protein HZB88_01695 [archaeon]|nr:hypothetical protein [archaeon]